MAGDLRANDSVVAVEDLVRVFAPRRQAPVRALDGVSLTVGRGEVHGLLGPNGAGKTTLVKILSTVLLPTSGRASVCGYDVVTETRKVQPLIGIVFGGERGLYTRLSGRQNLEYWAALYRLPRADIRRRASVLLDRIGLADRADERVETYSRGMKQRLHLARGLVADPAVLFLDEPTIGMDPLAAREFRTLVGELRQEGRTVLLTTHDMAEAEAVCDRVTLIDRGRILATESPRSLSRMMSRFQRLDVEGDELPLDEIAKMPGVVDVSPGIGSPGIGGPGIGSPGIGSPGIGGARIHVDGDDELRAVLRVLVDGGATGVRTSLPSLEEVYVHVIGDRGLEV